MNTNPDNMQFPFAKEALEGLDTQVSQDWNREQLDAMHMQFVAQWRQSMSTLVPAEVKILAGNMEMKTYEAFVLEAPSFADIQVFEIDALQTLCAWSFDSRWVAAAVDCLFGAPASFPSKNAPANSRTLNWASGNVCLQHWPRPMKRHGKRLIPFACKPSGKSSNFLH